MSEIIERVAMAMWVHYVKSASPPVEWHPHYNAKHWLETATERDRQAWRKSAQVAIEAMREPTVAMVSYARSRKPYDRDAAEVWPDMIDAALNPPLADG